MKNKTVRNNRMTISRKMINNKMIRTRKTEAGMMMIQTRTRMRKKNLVMIKRRNKIPAFKKKKSKAISNSPLSKWSIKNHLKSLSSPLSSAKSLIYPAQSTTL
jgi:hypothetical protein